MAKDGKSDNIVIVSWSGMSDGVNKVNRYMFKGSFPAFVFFKVGATIAILSIVIIYWQSQYY